MFGPRLQKSTNHYSKLHLHSKLLRRGIFWGSCQRQNPEKNRQNGQVNVSEHNIFYFVIITSTYNEEILIGKIANNVPSHLLLLFQFSYLDPYKILERLYRTTKKKKTRRDCYWMDIPCCPQFRYYRKRMRTNHRLKEMKRKNENKNVSEEQKAK